MSVLYTDRLILRPFCATDAQAMFDGWTQDARVAKYCRWHPHTSLDMTEGLLAIYMDTTDPRYPYRHAITLKDGEALIGVIDVVEISPDGTTAEIGYLLAYSYWNKGYMTEALEAMIAHLFACGFGRRNEQQDRHRCRTLPHCQQAADTGRSRLHGM